MAVWFSPEQGIGGLMQITLDFRQGRNGAAKNDVD
jgi:hypothetical protein